MTVLALIILLPILNALAIMLGAPGKKSAMVASSAQLVLTLLAVFGYDRAVGGHQYRSHWDVAPEWGLSLSFGADGLSLVMLLLTAVVTFAAVWVSPRIEKREGLFFACLLLIDAGAAGAFASLDLVFFYAFHELALIPTFLLIGIWGHGERQAAAWRITIYLAAGSIVLLVGLAKLYLAYPEAVRTFDMTLMQKNRALIPVAAQGAYASAPTPVAMLHAGVLKKFGLYGLLRVAVPLLPEGASQWAHVLLALLVCNILYIGLVTIAQKRLDLMLGYSSVMHMGYVFLGIAAGNAVGLSGAALLMLGHGLSIAALFAICGHLRESVPSLAFTKFGGLAKSVPFLGYAFGMAAFASIGLPGFANFAGEMMVFFGAFKSGATAGSLNFGGSQIATICGLWGVIISAVYMLRAYRQMFMGEPAAERAVAEPGAALRWSVIMLLAVLLLGGMWPRSFLSLIQPGIEALIAK
jgi:NADH-quinone oxidoreductase subunit M